MYRRVSSVLVGYSNFYMTFSPPPITVKTAATIIGACILVFIATVLLNHGRYQPMMRNGEMGNTFSVRDGAFTMVQTEEYGVGGGDGYAASKVAYDAAPGVSSEGARDMGMMVAPGAPPLPSSAAPAPESKIIRTAQLDILVADTDVAAEGVRAVSDRYQGQRGNEEFSQYTQDLKRGTLTIWVPSEHFDAAVRDIKDLALRVNTEVVNAQDVSAQFVDLTARLKNLRAAESQYQELMTRAGSIEDILNVTRQLSQTRQEIEQIQGQLDQLSGQVSLSSITVRITPEAGVSSPSQVVTEWRPGAVAKAAYRDLQNQLMGVGNGVIRFLIVGLPLLVIVGVQIAVFIAVVWIIYRLGCRVYRRMNTTPPTN
jgi:Domain of unknown function (DUF4349)